MKSFLPPRLLLFLQSGALVFLSVLLGILLMKSLWFCSLFTFFVILLFILHIDKQQQKLTEMVMRLITAIRFSDFSLSFRPGSKKQADPRLTQAMEQALKQFREKMYTLEEQHLYYNTLLSTIDSGILVLNRNGTIEWYNKTVLREFGLTSLRQLSELAAITPDLPDLLLRLIPGETHILRLEQSGRVREIALNPVIFRIQGKELLLISLKNIHSVLENNEIEAWQKLIRVLTHEIMNSLAPIISLSETLTERVARTTTEDATSPVMLQALEAIHRRSKGLLEFVQNYRKLTRIPAPELVPLSLEELFTGLRKLHATSVIPCEFICHDPRLQIQADRTQIEQVLLNLIRNAEEACRDIPAPLIRITTQSDTTQITIHVEDNGPGIVPEALDKIFVPFFTTKSGGSGIGLSLCKQIMTLHKGNITVKSQTGAGSVFTLSFRR